MNQELQILLAIKERYPDIKGLKVKMGEEIQVDFKEDKFHTKDEIHSFLNDLQNNAY